MDTELSKIKLLEIKEALIKASEMQEKLIVFLNDTLLIDNDIICRDEFNDTDRDLNNMIEEIKGEIISRF